MPSSDITQAEYDAMLEEAFNPPPPEPDYSKGFTAREWARFKKISVTKFSRIIARHPEAWVRDEATRGTRAKPVYRFSAKWDAARTLAKMREAGVL